MSADNDLTALFVQLAKALLGMAELKTWLTEQRSRLSRSSNVIQPIDYMLKRWDGFARFTEDGRICLTNNAAERALRGLALGRKAWLFAGSDEGASYCSSHHLLISPADFVDYRWAAAVVIGAH